MNIRRLYFNISIIMLLTMSTSCVFAHAHLGSTLPEIGDLPQAYQYIKAGDADAALGNVKNAINDYQKALTSSPFNEDATIGLARCAATEGDYATAIQDYQKAFRGHDEQDDIDYQTEYILVLNRAGEGQKAVSAYNHIVALCKQGYCVHKMQILPPTFLTDGSDYDSVELQAMAHVIRAMNSSDDDYGRMSSEIQDAIDLEPYSALVYYYQGVLLKDSQQPGATEAFEKAAFLADDPAIEKAAEDELK